MGEYAEISIDNEFAEWADDGYPGIRRITTQTPPMELQFKEILSETEKAWQLQMMGDAKLWWPKSQCSISGDIITVPDWLIQARTKVKCEEE